MVSLDEAVIARLESGGHKFEILIDPEAAQAFRENGEIDWDDALATEGVWSDSAKGEHAGDEAVQEVFGTLELEAVCTAILERGDIQLTAAQRKEMVERRHRQLVAHIASAAMNPQTGAPHPPQRIENALAEAKFAVDPLEALERQVERAVKALRPLLPISFEKMRVAVRIPAQHVGRCYGEMKALASITQEEYQSDGSWIAVLELAAGAHADLLDRLGSLTHGTAETKQL
ncbi:MAG: ribosome assembly factor SBDS [Euryarchaeota archaeon]|jgi:ribosome maturation protein SDO1|nr:ribosome assembly factor SBDS [Euryarchaeota archaeon]MDP6363735.1 ribosome assembly factor SBDS [Candidatus Poseidoniia archaeon]MDP6658318.1 ribosome assembly factor SBDS [Candidatus Poseidoniia archaeon]MDP6846439.1 ribosome assembly factor SBDS [Candidatus Poseidoniia archaeon]MDP7006951.1 ribosome assembly factor SBDS [Candidatus Poseidoniia archaeon]|tara:strand:- start:7730 stop:8422 length:693 start_codon:yes stop_codon:yes gene_type:complete